MPVLEYTHVDVFSPVPYSGNSLPVFLDAGPLTAAQMLRITQELRHFEAIFVERGAQIGAARARVFDLFEELPFAGHPLLGAAAVLHHASGRPDPQEWDVVLPSKTVRVATERTASGYASVMDQGRPELCGEVADRAPVADAFGLGLDDLAELPLEVVSTGLRYLIVPVRASALARAHISRDLTALLHGFGAQFAVLLDEVACEIRHWNNDGVLEDVATGSAAGTIGAYRLRHGLARAGETFVLHQGRFTGRPSQLRVRPEGSPGAVRTVAVGGDVAIVGRGILERLP
jgi:trans-2,3-dihydro-3-hydroxyanthranilate isomerase